MKKTAKLPTILGVIFLMVGLLAGLFLIKKSQIFRIGANTLALPKNVRITNITDKSLTMTWTTEVESLGYVKWGLKENQLNEISSEEDSSKRFIHSVNISGLSKDTNIYFAINSNSIDYYNNKIAWQSKTESFDIKSSNSKIASGTVLINDGSKPAKTIVYLTISNKLLSSQTSDAGSFVIPVSDYIENITDNTIVEVSISDGLNSISQAVIYAKNINPIPTIILNKTYDFRSLQQTGDLEAPKSSLSIPESIEISSRFEITKQETPGSINVSLESINEGEIINTTDPEFFGSAPKDTEIKIQVESELQTESLNVSSSGKWKWSPPNNLEPGEHKVTISWNDATGVLRTLTRSFMVQASEGPAFESTPSATPIKPVVTISPTSTPIKTAIPIVIATAVPVPETGSLTATIGLFIMGIGVLLSSIYIWNKSNVY